MWHPQMLWKDMVLCRPELVVVSIVYIESFVSTGLWNKFGRASAKTDDAVVVPGGQINEK